MIHDAIANLSCYGIPYTREILAFLKESADPQIFDESEIEIKGRDLFVRPGQYKTRTPQEGRFETHGVYADLQYVVSGTEIMQSAPADGLSPATEYDPKGDIRFFTTQQDITSVVVRPGEFVVYFPGEAHRPMCQRGHGPEAVRKLVFKIKI